MKKTYIIPSLEVIKVETQQMIAESIGFSTTSVDASSAAAPDMQFDDDGSW